MPDPPKPPRRRPTRRARGRGGRARASSLESFLTGKSRPEGALSYHETQGFLFAVAAAPDVTPPSDWIPIVFGSEKPELGRGGRSILDELIQLYNRITHKVSAGNVRLPDDCPFRDEVLSNFSEEAPVRQWSRGFLYGHNWFEESWERPLPKEMDAELGAVMFTLSFFSSRVFAEEALAEFSSGKTALVEAAELTRRTFSDAMTGYALIGETLRRALVTAPPPPPAKVGRNEPCPCGSGKKYKRCCESAPADLMERAAQRIRRVQDEVEPKVVRFLQSLSDLDDLERIRAEFACGYDEVEQDGPENSLFHPWLLYDWIPEQGTRSDRRSAAELFLERHESRLTPDETAFLRATCATPTGFHEVLEVEPGRRLRLRDLLLETEHEVFERSGSTQLQVGDLVYGRVVAYEGVTLLIGMGEIALPPQHKLAVIKIRTRLRKEIGALAPVMIKAVDDQLRTLYLGLREREMNPAPLILNNSDGESLEFHTITCDLESTEAAFSALASLATGTSRGELLAGARIDDVGRLTEVEIPWLSRKKPKRGTGERTVLGRIVLNGTRLEAEVNSAGRSRRLLRSLRTRLGSSMRNLTVAIKTLDEARADFDEIRDTPEQRKRQEEEAALRNRPEVREAMREFEERRWEAWVDEELPALDGLTPREAVREADGREKVEALLKQFERYGRGEDGEAYDFDRLRQVLGLEVL